MALNAWVRRRAPRSKDARPGVVGLRVAHGHEDVRLLQQLLHAHRPGKLRSERDHTQGP